MLIPSFHSLDANFDICKRLHKCFVSNLQKICDKIWKFFFLVFQNFYFQFINRIRCRFNSCWINITQYRFLILNIWMQIFNLIFFCYLILMVLIVLDLLLDLNIHLRWCLLLSCLNINSFIIIEIVFMWR